jgi:sialic acid synthase SpsE
MLNFNKKALIIAEIGNNHEGNFDLAKKLILLASKANADAVKFQTYITEKFIHRDSKARFKKLKKYQLSHEQFKKLKDIAKKLNLKFISTPLDLDSAKLLKSICDIVKIASSDNNFYPLLDFFIKSKKKIIISTGMLSYLDIVNLRKYILKKITKFELKRRFYFLYCVTSYPAEKKNTNLNSIKYLKEKTDLNIGYSDHTLGIEACIAARALGANIIEKHFTIDNNFSKFRDHLLSANPKNFKKMVEYIRNIELMLGNLEKKIQTPEIIFLNQLRRAPYASKNIIKNNYLDLKNVDFLRPEKKLKHSFDLKNIFEKKAKYNLVKGQLIKPGDMK